MSFEQVIHDETLMKIENQDIPKKMDVWVEKIIIEELPNPVIIDVAKSEKLDLVFIPPIPLPLECYKFHQEK